MAANQSRRRTEVIVESEVASLEKSPYRPLAQDVDCTRLVKIHLAESGNDQVVCSLVHVTFAERPKYEALSYMWGDEKDMGHAIVDGIEFPVRRNLLDALCYLREHQMEGSLFWVDALCINQNDTSERNRQLRIMRYIYFRAQIVVIWLGKKYSKYQENHSVSKLQQEIKDQFQATTRIPEHAKHPDSNPDSSNSHVHSRHDSENKMVDELYCDGYWERLWIIQEISQGQGNRSDRLKVCFGKLDMRWDLFIHMVTMHRCDNEAPLRLHRQLQDRYTTGYTLKDLFERHKEAKCSDPKDKIYGLIGLAADARDFPMDYNKSTYEIWEDTMQFMNKYRMIDQSEIVYFGRLIKGLLGLDVCTPPQQVIRPYEPDQSSTLLIEQNSDSRVIEVEGHILGYIQDVGPSTVEVAESLAAVTRDDVACSLKKAVPEPAFSCDHDLRVIFWLLFRSIVSPCSPTHDMVRKLCT